MRIKIPVNGTGTVRYQFAEGFAGMLLESVTGVIAGGAAASNPSLVLVNKSEDTVMSWPCEFTGPIGVAMRHNWQCQESIQAPFLNDVQNPFRPIIVEEGDELLLSDALSAGNAWTSLFATLSPL